MSERLLVLLIEDDAQIPRVLRHPLAAAGYDVLLAECVDAGLAAVAEHNPTLCCLTSPWATEMARK